MGGLLVILNFDVARASCGHVSSSPPLLFGCNFDLSKLN
jgi:hypothetical protein